MATKKKTPAKNKKLSQKAKQVTQTDMFKSVAIASVLLNILFLVAVVVLSTSSTFDRQLYRAAQEHYCNNTASVKERAQELGSEKAAQQEWQVDCVGREFQPYYQEALDKYQAQDN